MDFTILYRVLWKPGEVFKKFVDKTRPEPFIFIALIVPLNLLVIHRNDFQQFVMQPLLVASILLKGFYSSLKWPFLNGLIVYFFVKLIAKYKVHVLPLASAFIVCLLPHYILKFTAEILGYSGNVLTAGSLFPSLKEAQPFPYSFLATINPSFIWVIFLWHAALNQLLNIPKIQRAILLIILILFPFVFSFLTIISAVMVFNLFNPAS